MSLPIPEQNLAASFRLEAEHMVASFGNPDAAEAISAFMEKRTPQFHGD